MIIGLFQRWIIPSFFLTPATSNIQYDNYVVPSTVP
jgi:hypothetical protein